jgi:DnaJ family protein A protein 5
MIYSIDFTSFKYNLYDILNVKSDATINIIRKNFIKIIKNYHPDKNSELENDIYNHIIFANQILTNIDLRNKYDNFINSTIKNFVELKDNFNNNIDNININSKSSFDIENDRLNIKHKYNIDNNNSNIYNKFENINNIRNSDDYNIKKENIKNNNDFNKIFLVNKSTNGKFSNQIVEFKGLPSELSSYIIGNEYTLVSDIEKLYIEDSIQHIDFTSLDNAFILHPEILYNNDDKNYNNKIKKYINETSNLFFIKSN